MDAAEKTLEVSKERRTSSYRLKIMNTAEGLGQEYFAKYFQRCPIKRKLN